MTPDSSISKESSAKINTIFYPGDIPENKVVAKVYTRIKFGEGTNQVLRRSEMCSLRKLEQSPQVASLDPFVGFHTTILYYNIPCSCI